MNNPILTAHEACSIVGIAVRTSNQNGQAQIDIGNLWQRFFSQDIPALITQKLSEDVYCVYTDYESDHTGAYTTILGFRVENNSDFPEPLIKTDIPSGNYHCYTSAGKLPESLIETWQQIWKTENNRLFTADFDVYGSDLPKGPANVVKTFVSVKS